MQVVVNGLQRLCPPVLWVMVVPGGSGPRMALALAFPRPHISLSTIQSKREEMSPVPSLMPVLPLNQGLAVPWWGVCVRRGVLCVGPRAGASLTYAKPVFLNATTLFIVAVAQTTRRK